MSSTRKTPGRAGSANNRPKAAVAAEAAEAAAEVVEAVEVAAAVAEAAEAAAEAAASGALLANTSPTHRGIFLPDDAPWCDGRGLQGLPFCIGGREGELSLMMAEGPAIVADHAFTTGKIAQSGFEKPLGPSRDRPIAPDLNSPYC